MVGFDSECEAYPFYPISVSQSTNTEHLMINVLLIGNERTTHFVLIKSLDALLRKGNTRKRMFHCERWVINIKNKIIIYQFSFLIFKH